MNDLEKFFHDNQGNMITKWDSYFEVYDRHFSKYRGKEVVIVEVGVYHGGSLKMWKNYFGDKAQIIGIDINPECKKFEEDNIKIYIGSQEDRSFLTQLKQLAPKIDILIDDGGHSMKQQITTFEEMYHHLSKDGVYLCEDVHTSYFEEFGGGYKKQDTFIEFTKNHIDELNAWHSRNKNELDVTEFTGSTKSIHFYDSIVVFEKGEIKRPESLVSGEKSIKLKNEMSFMEKVNSYLKRYWYRYFKK